MSRHAGSEVSVLTTPGICVIFRNAKFEKWGLCSASGLWQAGEQGLGWASRLRRPGRTAGLQPPRRAPGSPVLPHGSHPGCRRRG